MTTKSSVKGNNRYNIYKNHNILSLFIIKYRTDYDDIIEWE